MHAQILAPEINLSINKIEAVTIINVRAYIITYISFEEVCTLLI